MKASRFTEAQIITILREAETGQTTIETVCRKHGVAEATFYRWRAKYGGLEPSDAVRLKELERENARLKKLLAERDLEIEVMKEVNAKKW
jgi:transposase-like protein